MRKYLLGVIAISLQLTIGLLQATEQPFLSRGDESGHGGNAIYCKCNNCDPTFETLDSWEGRIYRHLTLSTGNPKATPKEQALFVLNRLEKVDPVRAKRYKNWLETFESDSALLDNTDLNPVQDWGYLPIPKHCKVQQVIWQIPPKFEGDIRYWIKNELWSNLDNQNKAVLMLHEIIYRDALLRGQTDSSGTRYLNEFLSSTLADSMTVEQEKKWLANTYLDRFRFGFNVHLANYCGSPGPMALDYFDVGEMLDSEADTFCKNKGMKVPNYSCVDQISHYGLFDSPLAKYIRSASYLGKNQFWVPTTTGGNGVIYTRVFSFGDSIDNSNVANDSKQEVMCIGRQNS